VPLSHLKVMVGCVAMDVAPLCQIALGELVWGGFAQSFFHVSCHLMQMGPLKWSHQKAGL
jgi:hypothetical protein